MSFEVGDMVYLRLQPYKKSSLKKKGEEKIKPCFCGPYKVVRKVGHVAYELELPIGEQDSQCVSCVQFQEKSRKTHCSIHRVASLR